MSNFSQELWDEILIQASMNMDDGKCSMYRTITIPMKVRQGKYSKLKDWEKIFFYDGVKDGRWSKNGIHLKNNNPYKLKGKITE